MDAGELTDAQIRSKIKALRAVLLERQQRRARTKYLKAHPELWAEYGCGPSRGRRSPTSTGPP
jgi:hypothetical protein